MTCLNERVVGVIFFVQSGLAFAGGLAIDSPEQMTVANIAHVPPEVVSPIPEPQRYFRYQMQESSNQEGPFYTQIQNFYSAELTHEFRFATGTTTPAPGAAVQPASGLLHLGPSTAPQISIVQLSNTTLSLGAQPQRRLSLTVDDWVFSATARIAVMHSHSTGATVYVRRGF